MNSNEIAKRISQYEVNKKIIDSGHFKYVPFYGFPKLQKYIPGIIPGIMYKITSHMGVGKTQIAKFLFTYQPLLFAMSNNINFKIIYFALEESKEQFIDGLFIHVVRRLSKIQLDRFSLMGTAGTSATVAELAEIKKSEAYLSKLMAHIEVVDNKYKPTDIYNECKKFAKKWGKFDKDSEGVDIDSNYTPDDPNQIVLVITDHISLLEPEFDKESNRYFDERRSMAKWHTDFARRVITKQWNWAVLNVQQQSLDSEKQQFTSKGDTIINKILPSLDGLGENKTIGRDDFVTMGLFAPERYSLEKYLDYNIKNGKFPDESFGDRFRSLHLLKNRFGHPNKILPLYFDGRYTYFKEMPLPTDPGMTYFLNLLKK